MTASGNEKILRIGVIQGGKVIEERLVRKRTTVTFGEDHKNTFIFSGKEFPKSWPLFELKGSQYQLVFSDNMDGRVSVNDANVDFASLKAQNLAQKQGDRYRLTLNDSSRGRVQFSSDLTILFHFVAPPPVAAKPELPVSVKGGWVKSIEPIFTTVLTVSFLLHAVFTIVVVNVDPPPPPSRADIIRAIARVTPQKIETPPPQQDTPAAEQPGNEPKKPEPKDDKPADEPAEVERDTPKGGARDAAAAARAAEERRARVRDQIAGKGLLAMIGASGSGADGAVANVFGSGSAIGGDLQSSLEGTAGVGIAGGGEVTRRGAGGGGGAAEVGDLSAGGGGAVSTGEKKAAAITARVSADAIEGIDGTIDKKGVQRALRARGKAFQLCYENALKQNSKLKGKLVVEFTIGDRGRVVEALVVNDGLGSPQVSRCVLDTLKRVRFPPPEDGDVTITNTFVFQPGG